MGKSNKQDPQKESDYPRKHHKIDKLTGPKKSVEKELPALASLPLNFLTKDQLARLYRFFSRWKYNKYRHQFPRMRESQLVDKIIKQWQALDTKAKVSLFNDKMSEPMSDSESSAESVGSVDSRKNKKPQKQKESVFVSFTSSIHTKDLNEAAKYAKRWVQFELQKHYASQNPHEFKDFLDVTKKIVRQTLIKGGVPIGGNHDNVAKVDSVIDELAQEAMHAFQVKHPLDFKLQRVHRKNTRNFDEGDEKQEKPRQIQLKDDEDSDFERNYKMKFEVSDNQSESEIGIRHNYDHMKISRIAHGIKIINQTLKSVNPKHIDLKAAQTYERIIEFSSDHSLDGDFFWNIGPGLAGNNKVAMANQCKTCQEIIFRGDKLTSHQKQHYGQFRFAVQMLVSQKCNTKKFFIVIKTKQRESIIFGMNGINWQHTQLKLVVDEKRHAITRCEKMASLDSNKTMYHVISVARSGAESLQRSCQGMSQQQLQNEKKGSIGGNHILTKVARWSSLDMKKTLPIQIPSSKSYSFFHLKHVYIPTITCMYLKASTQSIWRAFPYINMMGLPDAIRRAQMLEKYLVDENPEALIHAKHTLQWIYSGIGTMPGLKWVPWFGRQILSINTLHFKELLPVKRDFRGELLLQKTQIQFLKRLQVNFDGIEAGTLINIKNQLLRILRNNCTKMFTQGIYFSQDKSEFDERTIQNHVQAQVAKTSVVMWNKNTRQYFLIGSGGKQVITEQEYQIMMNKKEVQSMETITRIDDDQVVFEISIKLEGLIWKQLDQELGEFDK